MSFLSDQAAKLSKYSDIAFALAILGIIMILLFPVHVVFLDLLLAISVTISVLILMNCLFINRPLDFSSFPTILLVTAIMRLSLNIASTRLILSNGHTGTSAAGHVIEAFGNFVMQGNIVIGIIVFGILTIINFAVITKGSGRIAEVAARFSLDAMPGKQMAVDADLSAGLIDEPEAKRRRKDLEDESTFFGAMDGANKFVRGDAVAGILITFINFIGGIIIGVVQRDLTFSQAFATYSLLTIGDGLVSQVPALLVSLAAGLLVSKSGVTGSTDKAIFGQLGRFPNALYLSSFLSIMVAFMPGIPFTPFALVGVVTGLIGYAVSVANKNLTEADTITSSTATLEADKTKNEEESLSDALHIDSIKLELGYGLLSLINYQKGNKLIDQIKALRKQIAKDLGFIIPSVRILDNLQLPNNHYVLRIKNIECGRGEVYPEKLMVMDPAAGKIDFEGIDTKEPAFGLPAKWIDEIFKEEAMFKNYTIVDPPTVIMTHLTEIIKENIIELLSYSETQKLIDELPEEHKKLAGDTIPGKISISGLQRVLQNLLSEMVSIRDLALILEAISEAGSNINSTILTEHIRSRLARQLSYAHTSEDGFIPVIALSLAWEQLFSNNLVEMGGDEKQIAVEPSKLHEFMVKVNEKFDEQALMGIQPILLVSPKLRPYIRAITVRFRPSISVISHNEIHFKSKIKTVSQV